MRALSTVSEGQLDGATARGDVLAARRLRTRVKICGITRIEDAAVACACGADAIGLVFYSPSPRSIGVDVATAIRESLDPFVATVGLFVNAEPMEVRETARSVGLDLVQYHGEEPPEQCDDIGLPYVKAVRVRAVADILRAAERYPRAKALLLDAYDEAKWGGSGKTFDWSLIPERVDKPLILAGGLSAANVAEALVKVRPYAVDVSGGVERSPGVKDGAKIREFIQEVDRVTTTQREG